MEKEITMNNLPTNDEMNIIRHITRSVPSAQTTELTESQLHELASLTEEQIQELLTEGGRLEAFLKMIKGLAQKLRPSANVELPPLKPVLPAPSLPPSGTIVPKGFGVWEPIPQPKAPSNLASGLKDLGIAAGLGTLGYLGMSKKKEQSSVAPEGLGVSASKAGTARAEAEEAAANVPAVAPSTPAPAPARVPTPAPTSNFVVGRARGESVPTRADEPNIPIPAPAKLPEQPMDAAATAAKMRSDRFAAEKQKATPEQIKQVEDNAKRYGVEPWTQEHYDAVGKSIEQSKQAIQTAQKDLEASQAALAARRTPASTAPTKAPEQGRDTSNIVPGSQMWGELSAAERKAIRDRYAKGEGPSISIRYNKETNKFDEPGYGDQGRYADIVKALNVNESVLSYCNFISENLGVNLRGYKATKKDQRKGRLYQKQLETRPEMSWSGDSASVPDLPKADNQAKSGVDPETFVKQHVINMMTNAQEKGIKMTHGQAHSAALDLLKRHMAHD